MNSAARPARSSIQTELAELRRQIAERRREAAELGRQIEALGAALRRGCWQIEFHGDRIICKDSSARLKRGERREASCDVAQMRKIVADLRALEARVAELEHGDG